MSLFKSRKFWLMVLDVVISTITYFVTAYVSPEIAEQIIWVIGAWQPVIVALIIGIAMEDAAVKGAPTYPTFTLEDDEEFEPSVEGGSGNTEANG